MAEKTVALLLACLVVASCGKDRGRCLLSHTEQRYQPASMHPTMVGRITVMIPRPARTYTVSVCDQWEFPDVR